MTKEDSLVFKQMMKWKLSEWRNQIKSYQFQIFSATTEENIKHFCKSCAIDCSRIIEEFIQKGKIVRQGSTMVKYEMDFSEGYLQVNFKIPDWVLDQIPFLDDYYEQID